MRVTGLYEQDASSYTLLRALFRFMVKGSPRPLPDGRVSPNRLVRQIQILQTGGVHIQPLATSPNRPLLT